VKSHLLALPLQERLSNHADINWWTHFEEHFLAYLNRCWFGRKFQFSCKINLCSHAPKSHSLDQSHYATSWLFLHVPLVHVCCLWWAKVEPLKLDHPSIPLQILHMAGKYSLHVWSNKWGSHLTWRVKVWEGRPKLAKAPPEYSWWINSKTSMGDNYHP
jgi:hypothetical protein